MAKNLLLNEGYTNNKYIFDKGIGSKIFIKRKKFVDLSFSAGSLLLGHNSKIFNQAIKDILKNKISIFANPNKQAEDFAKIIKKIYPFYSKFIFCSTGSEAIMKSLRIVKAITKKNLIVNVTGSWHGSNDKTLFTADKKLKVKSLSEGLSTSDRKNLRFIPYNDIEQSKIILDKNKKKISCVFIEPVQGCLPNIKIKSYLKFLSNYCKKNNIIFVFDEMITGIRSNMSTAQKFFNINTDISTFGKAFANGMPIGFIGISEKIEKKIKSKKLSIYFGGTFSGNSFTTYFAKNYLDFLKKNKNKVFKYLNGISNEFEKKINKFCIKENLDVKVYRYFSMLRVVYSSKNIHDRISRDFFEKEKINKIIEFKRFLKKKGIYYPNNGIIFFSYSSSRKNINYVMNTFKIGLKKFFS